MRQCSDVLAVDTGSADVSAARHTQPVKDNHS